MSDELRAFADELRTQLATLRKNVDEIGRDLRIALHHGETVTRQVLWLEHARKSVSAALVTAFDEMDKLDVLILAASKAAEIERAVKPTPGGNNG